MGRAQPKRRGNRRQAGASNGLPGWAMMTIGLIIGLFVAFLVYLDDLESPPASAVEQADDKSPPEAEKRAKRDGQDTGDDDDSPRFEFYSILPELEVVVPESGDSKSGGDRTADRTGGQTDDETGDADNAAAPPPEADGTFYLQAGSFQESDQADRMKARIALLGLDVDIQEVEINGADWHRVRVGPYTDPQTLRDAQQRLRKDGIDYLVMREKSSD